MISFFFYRKIIFKFSGARELTRKENPEIYNIVENLCISRGLPNPKIGIIDDDSLNAFATGRNTKSAWIVFSRGLINKLEKSEIEAVAAHELSHIINKDSLLMIVIIVFVGVIGTLGQILIRIRSRNSEGKGNILPLIGLIFIILGYLIYPFIQLAISRKREYLADAGSVELTKDKYSMISALQKISQDPVIESIEKDTVAAMCIQTPFSAKSKFKTLLSTHPSIEDRIKALQSY
ncbi:M48 family metallopeptidase [Candidatus Gracilibacteria bacterium]|nr:M48 family metallopeptidase [Candidatus Gracilibacteria bacterium]